MCVNEWECMCVWICEWCAWKVWIKIGRSYGCITAHNVRNTPTFNIVRMIPSVQYTLNRWAIQTLTIKPTADGAHWTCFSAHNQFIQIICRSQKQSPRLKWNKTHKLKLIEWRWNKQWLVFQYFISKKPLDMKNFNK